MAQQGEKATVTVNPQERVLYSNLYMQTSGEYYAACKQTYALAAEKLRARLLQLPDNNGKKPAAVMDLDETVIDNSDYQSFVDRERTTFAPETWARWEKDFSGEVGLIPGAEDFITSAERSGVTVVYLSNRSAENKEGTINALKANGLDTTNIEPHLLLQELKTPSDKTARRSIARDRYHVVTLVGDLRDHKQRQFVLPLPRRRYCLEICGMSFHVRIKSDAPVPVLDQRQNILSGAGTPGASAGKRSENER